MRFISEVHTVKLTAEEDVKKLPSRTAAGGGTANELRRISDTGLTIALRDFNTENIALATLRTNRYCFRYGHK